MNVAYLMNEHPYGSCTFIRREIRALEESGIEVVRLAIRHPSTGLIDEADRSEVERTRYILSMGSIRLITILLLVLATRPLRAIDVVRRTLRLAWRSDAGMIRTLAYLAEACVILRWSQAMKFSHIHAHFGTNTATAAMLSRLLGGPSYSFTVHGTDFFDAPRSQDISAKVANAAFVVAVCDYGAAQLRRWSAVEDWGKIHVVRCAIGDKFFTSARPIDRSSERFVCVGRLSPEKGQLVLLDALATLVREGSGARLVLAGDGDFRPEIERRIAQLDLADRVEITGFIPEEEVCRQVLGARAFVLASFTEGLPVVIMEAFALGRPVISTYVAGIPELVRPGENGWLVPAGNAAELASAMRAALNTPIERLEAMALAGSERVRSLHYTPTESARLAVLFGRAVEGTCGRAVG